MKEKRNRVFSGIQPTGDSIHLGNYHGAVRGMLALQETHECIYAVVDYHAITVPYDPAHMPRRVLNIAADYLAAGLDPARAILMVQSDVPEHVELAWLLGAQMPVPKFEQLPTYKDKKAHYGSASFGLLAYPILMAADILIYKATAVPVGKDQLPHLEFTRETARRFNNTFGQTFPEPQAFQTPGAVVPSLKGPGAMAKSVPGSYIALNDPPEVIRQRLARAYTDPARRRRTDPGEPTRCNVYAIHRLYTPPEQLEAIANGCHSAGIGCLECKRILADEIIAHLTPIQDRRRALLADPDYIHSVLADGTCRARPLAQVTLAEVKEKMGLGSAQPSQSARPDRVQRIPTGPDLLLKAGAQEGRF